MIKGLHPLVLIVIIANVLISIKGFKDIYFFEKYKFNVSAIKSNQWIRYLSSGFLHVDYNHLFLNMLSLYFFGDVVLYSIGIINFIFLYLGSLFLGNFFAFYFHQNNDNYSAVGASGAVIGVVFSAILLQPDMKLMFILFPIPLPGYVFGLGYLIYTLFGMKNQNDSIGHTAHFGGALGGVILTIIFAPNVLITSLYTLLLIFATILICGILFFKK